MLNEANIGSVRPEITAAKKEAFLVALRLTGNITESCRIAEISRTTVRRWRLEEPAEGEEEGCFAEQFRDALQEAADMYKSEAKRRAVDGWHEPVIHKGVQAYMRNPQTGALVLDDDLNPIPLTVLKKSDRMLELMLQATSPEFRRASGAKVSITDPGDDGELPRKIEVEFVESDGAGREAGWDPLDS